MGKKRYIGLALAAVCQAGWLNQYSLHQWDMALILCCPTLMFL